ncbi:MAG: FtsW/RodA/SpoVE family cell cycle protein [Bacteroidales bacterium]|nr:FtsW/RodA/SpoVE family cell cycle protein [Bacteroidales bacterium]
MADTAKKKRTLWNFFDGFEGDKVVWMIALLLMLVSVLCMFSSTSRLLTGGQSRIDVVKEQLILVAAGIGIIILIYNIRNLGVIRWLSKFGFIISLILLAILDLRLDMGFIRSVEINGARRILRVGPVQVHVFEVVKVAMIMYLAWAMDALKREKLKWGANEMQKKVIYIYAPFVVSFLMILPGSNSAAIVIGGMMFITILIGGGNLRDLAVLLAAGVLLVGIVLGLYFVSHGKVFGRLETGINRIVSPVDYEKQARESRVGSADYYEAIDRIRQPYSAKIAIHEGLIPKGPGQSTQRYVVPDISEDYMYSFIIEEYGILGGIFVLMLYISLLARGSLIVRNCGTELFPKLAVAGLTMLIVLQAFLHMFVNVDIGPMTGQTLPLVSHGTSAFLCFCVAFGIILSVSRYASRKIRREQLQSAPLVEREEIKEDLDALDSFETDGSDEALQDEFEDLNDL